MPPISLNNQAGIRGGVELPGSSVKNRCQGQFLAAQGGAKWTTKWTAKVWRLRCMRPKIRSDKRTEAIK